MATTLVVLGRAVELHLDRRHTLKGVHDSKTEIAGASRNVNGMRAVGKALELFPRAQVLPRLHFPLGMNPGTPVSTTALNLIRDGISSLISRIVSSGIPIEAQRPQSLWEAQPEM